MNESEYFEQQESAAFGQFLVETIANLYGTDANPDAISRAVYKSTDCGAWCKFDEYGIVVGTIVEGSEADYSTRVDVTGLDADETSDAILVERFRAAIAECEMHAAIIWAEMESEESTD